MLTVTEVLLFGEISHVSLSGAAPTGPPPRLPSVVPLRRRPVDSCLGRTFWLWKGCLIGTDEGKQEIEERAQTSTGTDGPLIRAAEGLQSLLGMETVARCRDLCFIGQKRNPGREVYQWICSLQFPE